MAFFEEVKARWLHVKNIGKWGWIVAAALWGMFWVADETISKWGSRDVKAFWDTYTLHFPIDWKIAVIGFLAIFLLMLIEGSFRDHLQTLSAHDEALAAADDQHRKYVQSSLAAAEEQHHKALQLRDEKCRSLRDELSAAHQQLEAHKRPQLTGEILLARRMMRISEGKGRESSMLLLKVRVSTATEADTTIRRAELAVKSDGVNYKGEKHAIDGATVDFIPRFGNRREELPVDLIEKVSRDPIRHLIGSEGWLQFYVEGLSHGIGLADLTLTLTDELGGHHDILAKSFSID